MKIIIDGDSSPFKEIVIELAGKYKVSVVIVLSVSHFYKEDHDHVSLIVVDNISQAADMKIFNITEKGDVVVTGDWGLASLILSKHAFAISPRGIFYEPDKMDYLLAKRHRDAKLRRAGERTKGPVKLTDEDREKLRRSLTELLEKFSKKNS